MVARNAWGSKSSSQHCDYIGGTDCDQKSGADLKAADDRARSSLLNILERIYWLDAKIAEQDEPVYERN